MHREVLRRGTNILRDVCALVLITAKIANPVHGEVYSMQHYVIKFISGLWQVGDFLLFHPPRYNLNIVEGGIK